MVGPNIFWLIIAIALLLILSSLFFIISAISRSTKIFARTASPLKRNIISVALFYLISTSGVFLALGPAWGYILGFKVLPILSLIFLLFLEILGMFREILQRTRR